MCCMIIHIDQKHGGKFFGQIRRERDYDKALNKPRMRMMMETYAAAELYLRFADLIEQFDVEIHLDIASDTKYGSNCAHSEAVGYVKGVCGLDAVTKPLDASRRGGTPWAASTCAHATKRLLQT